jgi:hypothetical protein
MDASTSNRLLILHFPIRMNSSASKAATSAPSAPHDAATRSAW